MKKFIFITGLLMSIFFYSCKEEDHGILPPIEGGGTIEVKDGRVTVNPAEYLYAIRNPMKGLREFFGPGYDKVRDEYPYPYGSIIKEYMQWNMLENNESDGVDKIIAYSNHRWQGVEDINVKVIPRIYIVWMEPWHGGYAKNTHTDNPDDLNGWHWPSDIPGETYWRLLPPYFSGKSEKTGREGWTSMGQRSAGSVCGNGDYRRIRGTS